MAKMSYEELQKKLIIDRNNLDEDVSMQAVLYNLVGEKVAELEEKRDTLKDEIKEFRASLLLKLRNDEEFKKVNESSIMARIDKDPEYVQSARVLREIEKELALWINLKESYSQRSYMLTTISDLFSSSYWSATAIKTKAAAEVLAEGYKRDREILAQNRASQPPLPLSRPRL